MDEFAHLLSRCDPQRIRRKCREYGGQWKERVLFRTEAGKRHEPVEEDQHRIKNRQQGWIMVQEADRLLQKIIFITIKRQEKQDVMGILLLRCFVTFL